jgi:hypothetical protein
MVLNGFEAFIIKHGSNKRSGIEFHASLYGDVFFQNNKVCHRVVEFISADTSAEMKSGSVYVRPEAISLKKELSLQMGFHQIGKMHSHPYLAHEMRIKQVRDLGFNFSNVDLSEFRKEIINSSDGAGYHLEVLLTIKEMKRQNYVTDGRMGRNVYEFSVGNCKCFLRAQVFSISESLDLHYDDTELICDYLENKQHFEANFGRIKPKIGLKRILEYVPK